MKFAFKFSNLLGTVYKRGNLLFSPDGNSVISPVGNKITIFDLRNNKSETLPIESKYNFTTVALAPHGHTLIAVDEEGFAILCSMVSRTVLHRYNMNAPVKDVKFSPDGKHFAVAKQGKVYVYKAPGPFSNDYSPFVVENIYDPTYNDTVCLDWSSDSRVLAVGCKDMCTRILAIDSFENLAMYTLGGHTEAIVGCFFEENSLNLYTLCRYSSLCRWECSTGLDGLIPDNKNDPKKIHKKKKKKQKPASEVTEELEFEQDKEVQREQEELKDDKAVVFHRAAKHYLTHSLKKEKADMAGTRLTSAAYHKASRILVAAYSNGAFCLFELPDVNLIHFLSLPNQYLETVTFNRSGDWIAMGSPTQGQLVVWEWQSETYIMKQQGHFSNMTCLAYSPDGQYIATGGIDAKVKLWDTSTGFCFVTFAEHQSGISSVLFSQNGKVIMSASLDGTVRAFDRTRYRNFRTFTSPRPTQFSCMALDPSGDIVCAGSQDSFEIFVWSMQTARLLDILGGHEGPVSSIAFSPTHPILVSTSWDKTVRVWDVFQSKGSKETFTLSADGLAVAYRPDGKQVVVATLSGQLIFIDTKTVKQTGCIEGRNDLGSGRKDSDLVTANTLLKGKAFTTVSYTADGACVIAGGKSKHVCIYHVEQQILINKFEITQNHSLDGLDDYINRRKLTDFGNMALVEDRDEAHDPVAIGLPGVKKHDMAVRTIKPEVRVTSIMFSPTGRSWSAASTEGLLVYSLDQKLMFDPFDLQLDITPVTIRRTLANHEYSLALMMAFRLNEHGLIVEVTESVPPHHVGLICQSMPIQYVERMLAFCAEVLESTRHLEFYLLWVQSLLVHHGRQLKDNSMAVVATLRTLQKNLTRKYDHISKICDHNKYLLQFILAQGQLIEQSSKLEIADDDADADSVDLQHIMDT